MPSVKQSFIDKYPYIQYRGDKVTCGTPSGGGGSDDGGDSAVKTVDVTFIGSSTNPDAVNKPTSNIN